jgi:hypothetical protein
MLLCGPSTGNSRHDRPLGWLSKYFAPVLRSLFALGRAMGRLRSNAQARATSDGPLLLITNELRPWAVAIICRVSESAGVPTVPDRPSLPGIAILASVLARRVRRIYDLEALTAVDSCDGDAQAFRFLLQGDPAVASVLLRYVGLELQTAEPTQWTVVRFSAWQNQSKGPPIARLIRTIAREGQRQRRMSNESGAVSMLRTVVTAAAHNRLVRAAVVLTVAGLVAALWRTHSLRGASGLLVAGAAVVGAVLTLSRAGRDLMNWIRAPVASGPARRADVSTEPGDELNSVLDQLGRPVAVFIEEVDTAKPAYAVELLDGIAGELRDVPIAYLIVADRARLAQKYDKEYDSTTADELLERSFQVSVRMPPQPRLEDADTWLEELISGQMSPLQSASNSPDDGLTDADARIRVAQTAEEVLRELHAATPERELELASEAVTRLREPEVERAQERQLGTYIKLLGSPPSPRKIKRFINAYQLALSFEIVRGRSLQRSQLALWTILDLRWPRLADYLVAHPDDVVLIGGSAPKRAGPAIRPLFTDPEVLRVVSGAESDLGLDADAIRDLNSA